MTEFKYYPLSEAHLARGTVVVIDVIRAFTTAAYAFEAGVERIYPVGTVEEALQLRNQLSNSMVMGEVDGFRPPEFDFGNSPAIITRQNLTGKRLIQRTSAGTQGIVRAVHADQMVAASFVVAGVTASYLQRHQPERISFIITGESEGRDGDEDRTCGEYIQKLVEGMNPVQDDFTGRVLTSSVGMGYQTGRITCVSEEDIELSLAVNRFNFIMTVQRLGEQLIMDMRRWDE